MDASELYKKAAELKSQGRLDQALTEFRRAVLADATHAPSHFEIGLLCKEKAKREPLFFRHTLEAFRSAARLGPDHAEAHSQYIMAGQKMGILEDLREEYTHLCQKHPDNPLLQKCLKNIIALSLAQMPDRVSLADAKASSGIKKVVLFLAAGLFFLSAALIIIPLVLQRKDKIQPETTSYVFRLGVITGILGLGGVVVFSRLK